MWRISGRGGDDDGEMQTERSISWTGITVSGDTFKKIEEETRSFRKRILTMAQNSENPDRTYHFNIQVFPTSKWKGNGAAPGGKG